jgi:hypothetical protein
MFGCSAEHPSSAASDQRIRTLVRRHRVEPRGFVPLWQRRGVAVIRAYGLCLGAQRSTHQAPHPDRWSRGQQLLPSKHHDGSHLSSSLDHSLRLDALCTSPSIGRLRPRLEPHIFPHWHEIVVSRAYGLCLGAQRSTHQAPYRISGSELSSRSGATGSSRAWLRPVMAAP